MFEIFLLVIGTGAIASFARGRGASPKVWGAVAVVGYILVAILSPLAMRALGLKEPGLLNQGRPVSLLISWMRGAIATFLMWSMLNVQ